MAKFFPPGVPAYIAPKGTTATPDDGATPGAAVPDELILGSERAFKALSQALGVHARSRLAQTYEGISSIYRTVGNGR